MYNERKDEFSIRGLLLQVLFVIVFVFLLMWIFPTKKQIEKLIDVPVYDNVFNQNIIAMKEAAKSYYTTPRLPQKVGDKVKMTLGQMLELKIILPFTDSKGRACSEKESYVEITKKSDEYIMKVNLKCTDEENYLLVYMGCYDYCKTTICEKNKEDVKSPIVNPVKVCKIKSCPAGQTLINPNSANCYCAANKAPQVCKIKSCPTGQTLINPNSPSCYCKANPTPVVKNYICEYLKTTAASYSAWGAWSEYSETPAYATDLKEVRTSTKTVAKQQKVLTGYKKVTYYDETKPIYETVNVKVGTKTTKSCAKYTTEYVATGQYEYTEWVASGTETFSNTNIPADTDTKKYIHLKTQYNANCGLCANGIEYVYTVYTRTKLPVKEAKYTCTQWTTKSEDVYVAKQILKGYETSTKTEPVYENKTVNTNVTVYSYRTRTLNQGTKDYKWDTCTNSPLLNQGYKFTGNKKEK